MLAGDDGPLASAGTALLAWYEAERRDLPWRRRSDPWSVWVSEIMLQQTRVETVCRYYNDFLRRFPDVSTLAGATEEAVLAAWSGLGYYRRARSLRRAATIVARAGKWPSSAAEWKRLPGIGEYTAAAISSISGEESIAVLDGNVERVVSRLLASSSDPKRAATRTRLREAAEELLDPDRPGDSNQALMELGATICRPRVPRCGECPLHQCCAGAASGDPQSFPPRRRRRTTERVFRQVVVARKGDKVLLFRRPTTAGQLAGFWELPWFEPTESSAVEAGLKRRYGGDWRIGDQVGNVGHSITHRRFEIEIHSVQWQPDEVGEQPPTGWYSREEIEQLATSSLVAKVLSLLPPR